MDGFIMNDKIIKALKIIIDELNIINDVDEKIVCINDIRKEIHDVSPLKHQPVDFVKWVKTEDMEGNEYNPNHVDKQNQKLLIHSITEDGYTMPIVTNPEDDIIKIVDGYHRRKSIIMSKEIKTSTHGYLPISIIRESRRDKKSRIASTVRHNRARGVHSVEIMSDLVVELVRKGWCDAEIAEHMGMNADEVLRLKQLSGIADIFKDLDYTQSWDVQEL